MFLRKLFATSLAVLALGVYSSNSYSSTLDKFNLDELLDNSQKVFVGTVSGIRFSRNKKIDKAYYTTSFGDLEVITRNGVKSNNGKINVKQMGGLIVDLSEDDYMSYVSRGNPNDVYEALIMNNVEFSIQSTSISYDLAMGGRYLIFLGKSTKEGFPFVGGEQGIYVVNDDDTVSTYGGFPIVGVSGNAILKANLQQNIDPSTIDSILVASEGGEDTLRSYSGVETTYDLSGGHMGLVDFMNHIQSRMRNK